MNMVLGFLLLILQSAPQAPVILAIGDSITAGYGVVPDSSYPAQLEKELRNRGYRYRVVNQGVTGSTTTQAVRRLTQALAVQPEIVIIQLGGNDRAQGIDRSISVQNVSLMIERFRPGGAKIFFAGGRIPYLDEVAREHGVPLIPLMDGVAGNQELLQADGIHPNSDGHAVVAANVLKALEPFLRK